MLQIVAQIVLSSLTQGMDAAEGFLVVLKMGKFVLQEAMGADSILGLF